jgi:hypothetical protein
MFSLKVVPPQEVARLASHTSYPPTTSITRPSETAKRACFFVGMQPTTALAGKFLRKFRRWISFLFVLSHREELAAFPQERNCRRRREVVLPNVEKSPAFSLQIAGGATKYGIETSLGFVPRPDAPGKCLARRRRPR